MNALCTRSSEKHTLLKKIERFYIKLEFVNSGLIHLKGWWVILRAWLNYYNTFSMRLFYWEVTSWGLSTRELKLMTEFRSNGIRNLILRFTEVIWNKGSSQVSRGRWSSEHQDCLRTALKINWKIADHQCEYVH